ncbi:hypothetical protein EMN47_17005 [Prolixibacteraceae bacterium JC049]|jgi:uncharacterized protein (UPF0332 family)|nr:hypothetical protein [Prolixibacteraceae bacterium JC049]
MYRSIQSPVKYQVKKSWELLEQADSYIYDNELNNAMLSLYNSCYIIARALLAQSGIELKDHEDVKLTFHKKFTTKGMFKADTERIYSRLYIYRREITENEIEYTDTSKIREYQARTQVFLKEAAQLL